MQIKSITDLVLYEDKEISTIKELLEKAVAVRANLVRANLVWANLYGANLVRANLDGANLYGANLDGANLVRANLYGANLYGANLYGANLYGANLDGANLVRANLDGATRLPTGESWETYLKEVVPALCTAGGKSLEEVAAAWDCHEWENCPMAVAFSVTSPDAAPILLRTRIDQFVQLFDSKLIPCPIEVPAAEACAVPEGGDAK